MSANIKILGICQFGQYLLVIIKMREQKSVDVCMYTHTHTHTLYICSSLSLKEVFFLEKKVLFNFFLFLKDFLKLVQFYKKKKKKIDRNFPEYLPSLLVILKSTETYIFNVIFSILNIVFLFQSNLLQ